MYNNYNIMYIENMSKCVAQSNSFIIPQPNNRGVQN